MKTFAAILLALAVSACGGTVYRDTDVPMKTVDQVDLTRYAGKWYEMARFPNRFEEGCEAVTAEYALRDDGRVDVLNTCRQGAVDGPVETAQGIARSVDPTNAKLEVKFVQWLPFAGDYWVLHLDEAYSVAAVGNPAGTTGWILARDPRPDPAVVEAARAALAANGYNTLLLKSVAQPGS